MNDKKLIIFRIIFNQKVGSGHLYQNLALIDSIDQSMFDIHVDLITDEKKIQGLIPKNISVSFSSYLDTKFLNKLDINSYFETFFINDILDTDRDYILLLKKFNFKIINIEDRGTGADIADKVINALYPKCTKNKKEFNGPKFNFFRKEFFDEKENLKPCNKTDPILVSFGGTDYNHLTEKIVRLLKNSEFEFNVLEPPHRKITDPIVKRFLIKNNSVAKLISNSSIIISSAGRTVFEANFLQRSSIVISQNKREASHSCINLDSCTYLGSFDEFKAQDIIKAINKLKKQDQNSTFYQDWLSKEDILELITS